MSTDSQSILTLSKLSNPIYKEKFNFLLFCTEIVLSHSKLAKTHYPSASTLTSQVDKPVDNFVSGRVVGGELG
jgi:hypothetical protein